MSVIISRGTTLSGLFNSLRENDLNLRSPELNETATFKFSDAVQIHDLLVTGPVDLSRPEWNFDLDRGLRSLARRGFYKIVGDVTPVEILNLSTGEWIPSLQANVIYSPSIDSQKYFRFKANIGTLVNKYGIGFNLNSLGGEPSGQIIRSVKNKVIFGTQLLKKQEFLNQIKNKEFYVSQLEPVHHSHNEPLPYHQVVWFLIIYLT